MTDKIIIMFHCGGKSIDVEIPSSITANELIHGLNVGFNLGIDESNESESFLRSENPLALIKGNIEISELGLRNGSSVYLR